MSVQDSLRASDGNAGATQTGRRWPVHLVRFLFLLLLAVALILVFTSPPDRRNQPGWSEAAEMPVARGELSAALGIRDSGCEDPPCEAVIVVGGFEFPFGTSDRAEAYFPAENRWERLPDMPGARHHLAAAALPDGTVVVTGGADSALGWDPTDDVWALAPDSNEWTSLDPLPDPRWGHRLVAVDDRLVLVGGHGGTNNTLVWSVDDGWTTGSPIPSARDHLGAVNVDDEVWVIGGRDDEITGRVDIYDPVTDEWRDGPPLPEPTSAAAVGFVDRTLVVVAGEDDAIFGGMVRESWMIDVDDVESGWQRLVRPPVDVHGAGDVVIGEGDEARLLIIGGAARHGAFSPLSWSDRVMVLEEPTVREE